MAGRDGGVQARRPNCFRPNSGLGHRLENHHCRPCAMGPLACAADAFVRPMMRNQTKSGTPFVTRRRCGKFRRAQNRDLCDESAMMRQLLEAVMRCASWGHMVSDVIWHRTEACADARLVAGIPARQCARTDVRRCLVFFVDERELLFKRMYNADMRCRRQRVDIVKRACMYTRKGRSTRRCGRKRELAPPGRRSLQYDDSTMLTPQG